MANATDERDVTDLLFLYSECIDTRRFARLGEVFTADAEVDLGFGVWRSLDTIIGEYERLLADTAGTAHAVSNVRVKVDGDSGRSTAYVHAWHWMFRAGAMPVDQPADFLFVALYRDDLVKLPEVGWRIRSRRARRVGPTALAVGVLPDTMVPSQR
jgi:hypothetical protein